MNPTPNFWWVIAGASAVSFALRAAPFVARPWFEKLSPRAMSFVHVCGHAIIGTMMAEAAFAPILQGRIAATTDTLLRLLCTVVAILLMVAFRRQVVSLLLSYGLFVFLYYFLVLGGSHG